MDGSSDVLTPLLELLLLDDKTRDGFVDKIMKRDDCELFVFFGTSFARHLCSWVALAKTISHRLHLNNRTLHPKS